MFSEDSAPLMAVVDESAPLMAVVDEPTPLMAVVDESTHQAPANLPQTRFDDFEFFEDFVPSATREEPTTELDSQDLTPPRDIVSDDEASPLLSASILDDPSEEPSIEHGYVKVGASIDVPTDEAAVAAEEATANRRKLKSIAKSVVKKLKKVGNLAEGLVLYVDKSTSVLELMEAIRSQSVSLWGACASQIPNLALCLSNASQAETKLAAWETITSNTVDFISMGFCFGAYCYVVGGGLSWSAAFIILCKNQVLKYSKEQKVGEDAEEGVVTELGKMVNQMKETDCPEVQIMLVLSICNLAEFPNFYPEASSPRFLRSLFEVAVASNRTELVCAHLLSLCTFLLDPQRLLPKSDATSSSTATFAPATSEAVDLIFEYSGHFVSMMDSCSDATCAKVVDFIQVIMEVSKEAAAREVEHSDRLTTAILRLGRKNMKLEEYLNENRGWAWIGLKKSGGQEEVKNKGKNKVEEN